MGQWEWGLGAEDSGMVDSGTVGQWGLGTGDSGMGVVSGTVGNGGWGIVAHEGDVAYNDDRQ